MKETVDIYAKVIIAIVGFFVPTINMVITQLFEKFRTKAGEKQEEINKIVSSYTTAQTEVITKDLNTANKLKQLEELSQKTKRVIKAYSKEEEQLKLFTDRNRYKTLVGNLFIHFIYALFFVACFYMVDNRMFFSCNKQMQNAILVIVCGMVLFSFVVMSGVNWKLWNKNKAENKKAGVHKIIYIILAVIFVLFYFIINGLINAKNNNGIIFAEAILLLYSLFFATWGLNNMRQITWAAIDIQQAD